jgi:glycosyltransferase involved in cell wall biosynthesis
MNSPMVSVIIPAHNAERYIASAIDSVLSQTYSPVECIVVDDGSTDGTASLVKNYGNRVCYLFQQNAERSTARNNGIAHGSGEYISFLDADDYLAQEKISEQVAYLEAHPEYDVVYSGVRYFGLQGCYSVRRITPVGDILPELIYGNFITVNSPLIRRSALEKAGGFDTGFNRYEDWDFLLRLALTGALFGYIDRPHVFVRIHPDNTIQDRVRMFEAKYQVARKIAERFGEVLRAHAIDSGELLGFHGADYGRILILNGRVAEGVDLIHGACSAQFPHRWKFRLFALAAEICGYRLLNLAQSIADRICKYRR